MRGILAAKGAAVKVGVVMRVQLTFPSPRRTFAMARRLAAMQPEAGSRGGTMMTELNRMDTARARAQVIDAKLSFAIGAHLRGAPGTELRRAVATFVADAKVAMMAPQDVILSLKTHVQREAQPHMGAEEFPRLVGTVVGWGIEEYYRER
jgi:hypothetical protein